MPTKATQFDNRIKKAPKDFRPCAMKRGYGWRWQKYRIAFLKKHPLCEMYCKERGIISVAQCVDHIIPHKGNQELFWDKTNHRAGCLQCHNKKTVLEDGGLGYEKKPETEGERILRVAMVGKN